MTEHTIMRAILEACNRGAVRLWRQNAGTAWQGEATQAIVGGEQVMVLRNYRRVELGEKNQPDLIGWVQRDGVAVYTGVEVKSPGKKPRKGQLEVLEAINRAGGIGIWTTGVEDALEQLSIKKPR